LILRNKYINVSVNIRGIAQRTNKSRMEGCHLRVLPVVSILTIQFCLQVLAMSSMELQLLLL